jgi:hypothetical protein
MIAAAVCVSKVSDSSFNEGWSYQDRPVHSPSTFLPFVENRIATPVFSKLSFALALFLLTKDYGVDVIIPVFGFVHTGLISEVGTISEILIAYFLFIL